MAQPGSGCKGTTRCLEGTAPPAMVSVPGAARRPPTRQPWVQPGRDAQALGSHSGPGRRAWGAGTGFSCPLGPRPLLLEPTAWRPGGISLSVGAPLSLTPTPLASAAAGALGSGTQAHAARLSAPLQAQSDAEALAGALDKEEGRASPCTPSTPSVCSPPSAASSVPSAGKNICSSCGLEILDRYLLKVRRSLGVRRPGLAWPVGALGRPGGGRSMSCRL